MERIAYSAKYCTIEFVKFDNDKSCFLLLDQTRETESLSSPLKLYRSSLLKMCQILPEAQEMIRKYNTKEDPDLPVLEGAACIVLAEINKYGNMFVKMVIENDPEGQPAIFVKLFFINDDNMLAASEIGVKLSSEDDAADIMKFVNGVCPPPKPLLVYQHTKGKFTPVVTTHLQRKV